MSPAVLSFIRDERGAVTVDWTVLSAAAVSMALATVAVLNDSVAGLASRMDNELRDQQMNDNFVVFTSEHFEGLYEAGLVTAEDAQATFDIADQMMNQQIIDALEYGITAMEEGTLTDADLIALLAVASVADQRNIVDDSILDYYFGFDGSTGRYSDAL
ncbi:MAG: hypothetical protein RIB61_11135 [Roseicyclus sp.]|jgi:Flp pilus assembly pilin Flp